MNIQELDLKLSIDFFDCYDELPETNLKVRPHFVGNDIIWTIDSFFSKDDCDEIISKSLKFEQKESRKRLISFDSHGILLNGIQKKMKPIVQTMETIGMVSPYGFYKGDWKCNGNVNQCLRINKYDIDDFFDWHRDSQFTQSKFIRSNYTILVYLNDNFEGGSTSFKIPCEEILHNGLTIEEELKNKFIDFEIKPKTGTAIIFDQRLLHKGNLLLSGTKYVFRTDLLAYCNTIEENNKLVNEIDNLTRNLFRQAELMELEDKKGNKQDKNQIKNLYDIVLSLRQNPFKLTEIPIHLKKYLTIINENQNQNQENKIKFKKRNAEEYYFETTGQNIIEDIISSSLFSVYFSNKTIENPEEYFKKHILNIFPDKKISIENNSTQDSEKDSDSEEEIGEIEGEIEFSQIEENYEKVFDSIDYSNLIVEDEELEFPEEEDNLIFFKANKQKYYSPCVHNTCPHETIDILNNIKFMVNEKFNSVAIFEKIEFENERKCSGKLRFCLPSSTFNHASCNHEVYYPNKHFNKEIKNNLEIKVNFYVDNNEIIISLYLAIVL